MGQEINEALYGVKEHTKFKHSLQEETKELKKLFYSNSFCKQDDTCGVEIEAWLIDKDGVPSPSNGHLLSKIQNENIVPEISKYNFEINSLPRKMEKCFLKDMEDELTEVWKDCEKVCEMNNTDPVQIGIMPTVIEKELNLDLLSENARYRALNDQILKIRENSPFEIHITGKDKLLLEKENVMLESAATSLQIHLKVTQENAKQIYNLCQFVSAPMIAISANAPYLFGKELWDETRVPLFEQSVATERKKLKMEHPFKRVSLGSGYIKNSILELFEENLNFPVLLPNVFNSELETLPHLRLHNGNIWRWNRPILGFASDGKPHLRIEHRVNSSGPTIIDTIANIAFFIGLVKSLEQKVDAIEDYVDFSTCDKNFYNCCKKSLSGKLKWLDGKTYKARDLILRELVDLSKEGLRNLDIDENTIEIYISIIEDRVKSNMNGAIWQKKFIKKYGNDFNKMIKVYLKNQKTNIPVHQWEI